jgi:hypothetical protein
VGRPGLAHELELKLVRRTHWRGWLLGVLAASAIASAFLIEPIPQDPAYHAFADQRTFLWIPNFWNVASNLPFALVGLYGLAARARLRRPELCAEYLVYCLGTLLVAFGSGYYHVAPSTPALAWDRLPMTIAFMALFALVLRARLPGELAERFAARSLVPLLLVGAASVAYWTVTERVGSGDLRPYVLVQFLPMLLIPALLLLYDGRGIAPRWLWLSLASYVVAKVFELLDLPIYEATRLLSGHSLKHLAAAISALCVVFAAIVPRPAPGDRGQVA